MRAPIERMDALGPDYHASTVGMRDKIGPYVVIERLREKMVEDVRGFFEDRPHLPRRET